MRRLNGRIYPAIFALALACSAALGQMRFPKVPRPKPPARTPQTPNPAPQNPNASPPNADGQGERGRRQTDAPPASADSGAGKYIDDGYAWFEAASFQTSENGSRVDLGWALKSSIRLFGEYPNSSAFKFVVTKAGRPVATTRCEASATRPREGEPEASSVWTDGCFKKETATKELGRFDVQVLFVSGDTDAETVVRNYKIEVLKADRVTGPTTRPIADTPQYYISRHAEAPVSFLFLRPKNSHSYHGSGPRSAIINRDTVEIYFSLSPSREGMDMRSVYVRCTVNGRPLEMEDDKVENTVERQYAQVYTDRLAPQFKSGTEYRDEVGFSWVRAALPFTFGAGAGGRETNVSSHPGAWECRLMNNGATWRTWRWRVGPDGMPVRHPEQDGNVNLYPNAYLIETEIPAGGAAIDKRLAPVSAVEGFFYGQPWRTPQGRAMAARVPSKGSPAPVPSNRTKQGEDER